VRLVGIPDGGEPHYRGARTLDDLSAVGRDFRRNGVGRFHLQSGIPELTSIVLMRGRSCALSARGHRSPVTAQRRRRSSVVNRAIRSMAAVLICTTLGIPALTHANPQMRWQIRTAPAPMSLRVALGSSDVRCRKCRADRSGAHRFEIAGLRPTVTGWTRPLGLRIALRW
jgi:hypothetical protein